MPRVAAICVSVVCLVTAGCRPFSNRQAAAVLMDEFETVVSAEVNRLPFEVTGTEDPDPRRMLFMPFGLLFAALDSLGDSMAQTVAAQTTVVLGGMKDFRAPHGLGGVSSRACYILIVKPRFRFGHYTTEQPKERIGSAALWIWSARIHEYGEDDDRPSTFYVLESPGASLLLCNDDAIMRRVARALENRGTATGGMAARTDWTDMSRSPYWIHRRYRFADAADPVAAGIDDIRRDAESLVFFTTAGGRAVLRMGSSQAVANRPEFLIGDSRLPALMPVSPHSWQAIVPLSGGTREWEGMFIVMGLMGFAVYL